MTQTQEEVLKIAAQSYAGKDADPERLNSELRDALLDANDRIERAKGTAYGTEPGLRSSQVIVGICMAWELARPSQAAYSSW